MDFTKTVSAGVLPPVPTGVVSEWKQSHVVSEHYLEQVAVLGQTNVAVCRADFT